MEWNVYRIVVLNHLACDLMDCSPPDSSVRGDFSRQEHWSGLPLQIQGIFPTQESNPGLPQCRRILYYLSHQGSLYCIADVLYFFVWLQKISLLISEDQTFVLSEPD